MERHKQCRIMSHIEIHMATLVTYLSVCIDFCGSFYEKPHIHTMSACLKKHYVIILLVTLYSPFSNRADTVRL